EMDLISGNAADGVDIGGGATGTEIAGCFIGTDIKGKTQLPNIGNGVSIASAGNFLDGGNVISRNSFNGVLIAGPAATGNLISESFIGTDVTGKKPLSNGKAGVAINASGNDVGDPLGFAGPNVIAFNLDQGVLVSGGTGNDIF